MNRDRSSTSVARSASLVVLLTLALPCIAQGTAFPSPPPTAAEDMKETIHGIQVSDPYQWLEDSSSQKTRAWIKAQQDYTDAMLSHRPEMAALRKDVLALSDIEEAQRVIYRHGRYFILKKVPGQQLASLYMREGEAGPERVLIDANTLGSDHATTIDLLSVTPDGNLVAYGVRKGGRDQLSIHFLDVRTGHDLKDVLPEARDRKSVV